jgi:hypothetical protein
MTGKLMPKKKEEQKTVCKYCGNSVKLSEEPNGRRVWVHTKKLDKPHTARVRVNA